MSKTIWTTNVLPGDELEIHECNIIHTETERNGSLTIWYYEVDNE